VGRSPGVERGGSLTQILRELEIECLPGDIPDRIDVDISNLEIGESIHVDDLHLSKEINIITDKRTPIATISGPMVEEEKMEEEAPGIESSSQEMKE
jgi:large subunit ribosomal protein L25